MLNRSIDISIIIPGFNCAETLGRCFDSILRQQFSGLYEVIYSDDASTDESLLIAKGYIHKFNAQQLKVLQRSAQSGSPSEGRNTGISCAKGEYLFFLDADDTINSSALETLLTVAKKNCSDYVCSLHAQIRSSTSDQSVSVVNNCGISDLSKAELLVDGEFLYEYFENYFKYTRKYCLFEHCWGRLYRTSTIIENNIAFDVRMDQLEDVFFNSQVLRLCTSITIVLQPLYNHHLSANFSRLSLRTGEKTSLLPDLLKVSLSLASLYLTLQKKIKPVDSSAIIITQFLSSKVANYLMRLLIQLCRIENHSDPRLESSFMLFHDFYVKNSLYLGAFPAADESRTMRKLFRFRLPIKMYIWVWKIIRRLS